MPGRILRRRLALPLITLGGSVDCLAGWSGDAAGRRGVMAAPQAGRAPAVGRVDQPINNGVVRVAYANSVGVHSGILSSPPGKTVQQASDLFMF